MLNPKKSIISKLDRSARVENDPYASIVERCRISRSAEEILGTCGFAGEDNSEERTQRELHHDTFGTAAQTLPPIYSGAAQNVACTTSKGVIPDKAANFGKVKDSSVPMDCETVIPEVVDVSADSETEIHQLVKRRAASDDPNRSELPSVVRGSGKAKNVQESAIGDDGDDQRPSKMAKLGSSNVLKEIAGHQKSFSVQNVQDSTIGDDQRPSKTAKFDVLSVLKEISEHQKSSSSIPRSYGSLTFPRPKWWPEEYEDIV